MRSIPIDVVRAFVAVVEARGFTRAAEDLGRSQPTVSLQVKRLEELRRGAAVREGGALRADRGRLRLLRLRPAPRSGCTTRCSTRPRAARRRGARLRIGMPGEFAARLTPRLEPSAPATAGAAGFEVVTGESEALALAFRQNGARRRLPRRRRRRTAHAGGALARAARLVRPRGGGRSGRRRRRCGSSLRRRARRCTRRRSRRCGAAGRPFEIVCASADFAVRSAAVVGRARRRADDRRPRAGGARRVGRSGPARLCRRSSFRSSRAARRSRRPAGAGRRRASARRSRPL